LSARETSRSQGLRVGLGGGSSSGDRDGFGGGVDTLVINSVDADGIGGRGGQANKVDSSLGGSVGELERADLHDEVPGQRGDTCPLEADDAWLTRALVREVWNGGVGTVR